MKLKNEKKKQNEIQSLGGWKLLSRKVLDKIYKKEPEVEYFYVMTVDGEYWIKPAHLILDKERVKTRAQIEETLLLEEELWKS